MRKLFWLFFILSTLQAVAQEMPVNAITDSLLKNADAVVRFFESDFVQTDKNNATHKVVRVVSVLKEDGKRHGSVVIYLDKFRELKSFSGTVTNASGKVVRKIGKKDLTTTAYSSHIASDDKYSHYEYQPSGYPYTFRYEYEVRIKNGIPFYPSFFPVTAYNLSVEQSRYRIQVPSDIKMRYKAERILDGKPSEKQLNGATQYEWSVTNLPAIEHEPYSPGLMAIVPMIQMAPDNFCMDGQCGNMSDWNSMGKWLDQLSVGRKDISPQLKEKLMELTADAGNDKEKVMRVYKYLQSATRYVSIQLGIGGLQPMPAMDVEKTGFGDCKALSNYMQSMLTAIGISSVYTVISTEKADLYNDFSSLGQMNHAILAVPMTSDTLWLECTSQTIPFNYAHSGIAGHQCLLVTPEGGKVCRVRKLSEIGDDKTRAIVIEIDEAGNGKAQISAGYRLGAYDDMQGFVHNMSREEQINSLTGSLKVAKAKIEGLKIRVNDTENPDIYLDYNVGMERFANKSGNRLFVPFSLLQPVFAPMNSTKRKQDIEVKGGILRNDTIRITIPTGYTAESIPKPTTLASTFGDYSIDTRLEGNTLFVTQHILIRKGLYPASAAEEFKDFFKNMEKEWSKRAVFKQI